MGKHDRGAFGDMLDASRVEGAFHISFLVDLTKDDDSNDKWTAFCEEMPGFGYGRTGEEAFRALREIWMRDGRSVG